MKHIAHFHKRAQKEKSEQSTEKRKKNKADRNFRATHMRFMRCGKFIGPPVTEFDRLHAIYRTSFEQMHDSTDSQRSPFNLLVSISRQSIVLLFLSLSISLTYSVVLLCSRQRM